ncbi:MAG: hypothetical protein KAR83_06860 [Thermodesulfovibrionales bacterium]|nr:hypothetical protein [Thermodesulfovibrionales bacterium]
MLDERRKELFERIRNLVHSGPGADTFETLCMEVFEFQYQANEVYRAFCDAREIVPSDIGDWTQIPAFPSDVFKRDLVISFPYEKIVMEILTSGTTCPELRGCVLRDELGRTLGIEANAEAMSKYLFPEGEKITILVLAPSPDMAPTMGMAVAMGETVKHFGDERSGFFITRGGMKTRELLNTLRESEKEGRSVAVIGATGAFVYFFQACKDNDVKFALPPGSRIIDGGGYRGRFGECTREMYYEQCREFLDVPEHHCINVLGMGECTTGYPDNILLNHISGVNSPRFKPDHPWTRTQVYDMETCTKVIPDGEVGLLRHYDLTNLPTVVAVQTENLGCKVGEGFEIVGRAKLVGGKVSHMASEKPVGPMGDRKIFRFLDAYMKFSITRNIKKLGKEEARRFKKEAGQACECGEAVEEMIESGNDKPDSC